MRALATTIFIGSVLMGVNQARSQTLTDISDQVGITDWQNIGDVFPIDWNNDNCMDFIAHTSIFASVFLNNCNGTFTRNNSLSNDFTGVTEGICAGDLNNDGNLDIVATNDGSLTVYSIENGICVSKVQANDLYYGALRLIDSDANGDLEIVATASGNGDLTLLIDVDGEFNLTTATIFNNFTAELGVADMNEDGFTDIFVTRNDHTGPYGGYNIEYPAILRNTNGQFGLVNSALPMVPHYPVTFFDYDNDLQYDAHIGSDDWIYNGPEKVWLLRNGGNFGFSDVSQGGMYYGWNYYGHIEVLDVENDGDYDYFQQMGAWNGSRLLVNNQGNFSVDPGFEFPGGNSNKYCGLIDFDNDGDLDVLFTEVNGYPPSHFSFYRNESTGNFLTVTPVSAMSLLNTHGIRMIAYAGGRTIMPQMQESTYGFTRQFNIGLGSVATVDSLVVYWPGQGRTRLENIAANQFITVYQSGNDGTVGADEPPTTFALGQNSPNPFNPTTVIPFHMPETGEASLKVYSLSGQLVATLVDGMKPAGSHEIQFDASQLPAGTYVYEFKAGERVESQKMLLIK